MAYADLEILADRVYSDLERYFGNRRAAFDSALQGVLELLLTAHLGDSLRALAESGEVRGLWTHTRALEHYLQETSQLPEALCARYKYKVSEVQARRRFRIRPRVWRYFHDLAAEIDWDPALNVPLVNYDRRRWHDALEEQYVGVEVVLDAQALETMLISAMEGYLSPRPPRRKGCEVYGVNLGMTRDVHHHRPRDGVRLTRYVSVMRAHPQLSADGEFQCVQPNPRSLDAILAATQALYPQYQAVGDFHSHPYDEPATLYERRGWTYSESDEDMNVEFAEAMAELGQRIWVCFILAIVRTPKKVARSRFRGMRNTIQMTLGNCRVILAAYRSLGSGRFARSNLTLRLSGTVS
jgi:hypothetical protein